MSGAAMMGKVPFKWTVEECGQVRSGVGTYAGAARRRVHLAPVLLWSPSGDRPGRRQARHARILQIGHKHEACGRPSAWSSHSDLDEKESDERDPPQGVAPHAHRGVVGAHAGDLFQSSLPEFTS